MTREERELLVRRAIEDWDADRATEKILTAWQDDVDLAVEAAFSRGVTAGQESFHVGLEAM
jgi:hypothetical protein